MRVDAAIAPPTIELPHGFPVAAEELKKATTTTAGNEYNVKLHSRNPNYKYLSNRNNPRLIILRMASKRNEEALRNQEKLR